MPLLQSTEYCITAYQMIAHYVFTNCMFACYISALYILGAHPSGRMGEDPNGIPNNLTPYLSQVS
jgi:UDP-glucose 4-epimerase